ncbi:MAG: hypothetical protein FWD78_03775 [Treponema sp.]|nr:hypothetical protein [Treponema sp.]
MNDRLKIYMIGNAHIDPVWLWRWSEGAAEIKATFRSALDRLNEFDDFIFASASAAYYEWVEQNEPAMFEEIKQRVKEGRWELTGGWWVEPDLNIPSGESFARHALYGQRYFMEKFGRTAKVAGNVDSFGQNAMLPQLLKKSGMPYYIFMRGASKPDEFGEYLFTWESSDNSRITTFRLATGYGDGKGNIVNEKIDQSLEYMKNKNYDFMCLYGVGNHGGGPTITNIKNIIKRREKMGSDALDFSTLENYFEDVVSKDYKLPVIANRDFQHETPGCYTAHVQVKLLNRKAEQRLLTAETMSAISALLVGRTDLAAEKNTAGQLRQAWKRVLFNQFHDVICGCSIKEAYDDIIDWYGEALSIGGEVLNSALQKISWNINTEGDRPARKCKEKIHPVMNPRLWEEDDRGIPMVVFNPHSWKITAPVQVRTVGVNSVSDDRGNMLPVQIIRGSQYNNEFDRTHTLFMGTIPAFGYRVFWLFQKEHTGPAKTNTLRSSGPNSVENDFYSIDFDPKTGSLNYLTDKRTGTNIFSKAACVPVVIDERTSDTWGHYIYSYRNEIGAFGNAAVSVIEQGPVRAWIRITSSYDRSELRQDFMLHAGSDLIEVRVRVDWRQKNQMLKLSFPLALSAPKAVFEIPYGTIERECDGDEMPAQNWVDLSGKNSKDDPYGMTVITDSKYGYDVMDSELRLTVIRSPLFAENANMSDISSRDVLAEHMDQGVHEFRYWLRPHTGLPDTAQTVKTALECNTEPAVIIESYHSGNLPLVYSGIKAEADNVTVTVFKRAEDNSGYILRAYETAGTPVKTQIDLPLLDRQINVSFGKHEIKTLFIPDDINVPAEEKNLVEY